MAIERLAPLILHISWTAPITSSPAGTMLTFTMHQPITPWATGARVTITETTTTDQDLPDAVKVLQKINQEVE